eukprot:g5451.t1
MEDLNGLLSIVQSVTEEVLNDDKGGESDLVANEDIARLSRRAEMSLLKLKARNRRLYSECDRKKKLVEKAKYSLDAHLLQLQNLTYERDYLTREIEKCRAFETPELDKIGVDEKDVDHKELMGVLTKKLTDRMEISVEKELLTKKKDTVQGNSLQKEKLVTQLPKALANVRRVIEPLRELMPRDATQHSSKVTARVVKKLPLPLYVLFSQISGFNDAFRTGLNIEVNQKRKRDEYEDEDTEEEEEEEEEEEGEEVPTKRGGKECLDALFKPFYMTVDVSFPVDANKSDSFCSLRFSFLPKLHIMTVLPLDGAAKSAIPIDEVERALKNLFPGDSGNALPSSSARHAFAAAAASNSASSMVTNTLPKKCGQAFRWLQLLAGLQSMGADAPTPAEVATQTILRRLHDRLSSRCKLQHILRGVRAFDYKASAAASLFPDRIVAEIASWLETTTEARDDASGRRTFYGVLKNKKQGLNFVVEIPAAYPIEAPRFFVNMSQITEVESNATAYVKHLSANRQYLGGDLQEMETEVNIHYEELLTSVDSNLVLSLQITRLRMCFDALDRASSDTSGIAGSRLRRGRDRRLAFKFDPASFDMVHR